MHAEKVSHKILDNACSWMHAARRNAPNQKDQTQSKSSLSFVNSTLRRSPPRDKGRISIESDPFGFNPGVSLPLLPTVNARCLRCIRIVWTFITVTRTIRAIRVID
jgi:hypothetical protein